MEIDPPAFCFTHSQAVFSMKQEAITLDTLPLLSENTSFAASPEDSQMLSR